MFSIMVALFLLLFSQKVFAIIHELRLQKFTRLVLLSISFSPLEVKKIYSSPKNMLSYKALFVIVSCMKSGIQVSNDNFGSLFFSLFQCFCKSS